MTNITMLINRLDNDYDMRDVKNVEYTAKAMLDAGTLRGDVYAMVMLRVEEARKNLKDKK